MIKLQFLLLSFLIFFSTGMYAQHCQWAHQSVNTNDVLPRGIVSDASGYVYVMGDFASSAATFGSYTLNNTDSYSTNIFVVKYDSTGNAIWAKSFGDSIEDIAYGMVIDGAGNIYIAGNFSSNKITFGATTLYNQGHDDIFLAKLNGNGNVLWAKQFRCGPGGNYFNAVTGLAVDGAGHIAIAGYLDDTVIFGSITLLNTNNSGYTNVYVAKLDTSGNAIWAKTSTGIGGGYSSDGVALDAGGNIYLAGVSGSGPMTFDAITMTASGGVNQLFLLKFNSSGTAQWVKTASGDTSSFIEARGLAVDAAGNICLAGGFSGAPVTFGSTVLTNMNATDGSSDIFALKYDPSGSLLWAKSFGGSGEDNAYGLATDRLNNIYITGSFLSPSITFGSTTLGNIGFFAARLSSSGTVAWAKGSSSLSSSGGYGTVPDGFGNLYVTGAFNTSFTLDGTTLSPAPDGYVSAFIARFNNIAVSVPETTYNPERLMIYPNPAQNKLYITGNEGINKITITDLVGTNVLVSLPGEQTAELDISGLPAGVYVLKINDAVIRKIVKQ